MDQLKVVADSEQRLGMTEKEIAARRKGVVEVLDATAF
jgi:hypothetical protein